MQKAADLKSCKQLRTEETVALGEEDIVVLLDSDEESNSAKHMDNF